MAKKKAQKAQQEQEEQKKLQIPIIAGVPTFMNDVEDQGLDALKNYIIPPRIKIVQRTSGDIYGAFQPGAVVVTPQLFEVTAEPQDPIHFVPIFFFPEWCLWNPIQMNGTLPMIRERTVDPQDPMVALCRDPKRWTIPCPENESFECRYIEHLNFIILVVNNPSLDMMLLHLSFFRAEHRTGTMFAGLIKMRHAPLYGCQFEMRTSQRTNPAGTWFGFDIGQPHEDSGITPFIQDETLFNTYHALHDEMHTAHEQVMLRPEYELDAESEPTTTEY